MYLLQALHALVTGPPCTCYRPSMLRLSAPEICFCVVDPGAKVLEIVHHFQLGPISRHDLSGNLYVIKYIKFIYLL